MKQQCNKDLLQHKEKDLNQKGKAWEISVLAHEFQKCKQYPRAVRQGFMTHKSLASQVSLEPVRLLGKGKL